jgi:FAD/FMN-containing dehydrogenase
MPPALPEAFVAQVAAELPGDILSVDPALCAAMGRDWTRSPRPDPGGIARPRSTAEVARLVQLCRHHQVAMVPSGGRTGLAGGATAARGELVISLVRMNAVYPVDTVGHTVAVQAGAVTQAVHAACAAHGLTWPIDFAAKGSSHIGGNIATNAGGLKVLRYGPTRNWVLGLEVVLASGDILTPGGALEKNATGLDLKQLFVGSEGTLGIITGAVLKLVPLPVQLDVLLFAVDSLAAVMDLYSLVRRTGLVLSAYEVFDAACMARLKRHRKMSPPFAQISPYYVLIEIEAAAPAALVNFCQVAIDSQLVTDGTQATSQGQAQAIWQLREGISESLSATGVPHKNDVALPIAAVKDFCVAMAAAFAHAYQGWEVCIFGHVGDGNLHINVMQPDGMAPADFAAATARADETIFALVRQHGGSISAEHGIGLLKKPFLHYSRSQEQMRVLRAIKTCLDPDNLMNPGKIFDL